MIQLTTSDTLDAFCNIELVAETEQFTAAISGYEGGLACCGVAGCCVISQSVFRFGGSGSRLHPLIIIN